MRIRFSLSIVILACVAYASGQPVNHSDHGSNFSRNEVWKNIGEGFTGPSRHPKFQKVAGALGRIMAVFAERRNKTLTKIQLKPIQSQMCTSQDCHDLSDHFNKFINSTLDPCEDFHEFVCSKYIKSKEPIRGTWGKETTLSVTKENLLDKVREDYEQSRHLKEPKSALMQNIDNMYENCLQHEPKQAREFLNKLIRESGGWPLAVGESWDGAKFSWDRLLAKVWNHLLIPRFYISINFNLDPIAMFLNPGISINETAVLKYAKIIGVNRDISSEMDTVRNFEQQTSIYMKNIHHPEMQDLINEYPEIEWPGLLNPFMHKTNLPLRNTTRFEMDKGFFKIFLDQEKSASKSTIANFIFALVITEMDSLFVLDDAHTPEETREKCWTNLMNTFQVPLVHAYLKRTMSDKAKEKLGEIKENIFVEFALAMYHSILWPKNGHQDIEKFLNGLTMAFGLLSGDGEFDSNFFDYFDTLNIPRENYVDSILNFRKYIVRDLDRESETLGFSRRFFGFSDAVFTGSKIIIASEFLQSPFFDTKQPDYMNYGGFASIFGHELSHGIDWNMLQGSENYQPTKQCIVEYYRNYTGRQDQMTFSEDLPDIIGYKLSYGAYVRSGNKDGYIENSLPGLDYTPEQMFWISAASHHCERFQDGFGWDYNNPHSLPRARITAAFAHLEEFAKDFQCKVGSPMNPEKKCRVMRR